MKREINTKFYSLHQNNSGGYYQEDKEKGIGKYIVIEALNHKHASSRADEIGLDNYDSCPCCGDRWDTLFFEDGEDTPVIENKSGYIHFIDGTFVSIEEFKPLSTTRNPNGF